jgi:hypothetical protein
MAITNYNQQRTYNSKHWLYYQDFYFYDDATGSEYIQLREAIRQTAIAVQEELDPHGIRIADVRVEEGYDHRSFERIHRVAFGFASQEDLAIAKILIKCHV